MKGALDGSPQRCIERVPDRQHGQMLGRHLRDDVVFLTRHQFLRHVPVTGVPAVPVGDFLPVDPEFLQHRQAHAFGKLRLELLREVHLTLQPGTQLQRRGIMTGGKVTLRIILAVVVLEGDILIVVGIIAGFQPKCLQQRIFNAVGDRFARPLVLIIDAVACRGDVNVVIPAVER